jgi:hypothetical protein
MDDVDYITEVLTNLKEKYLKVNLKGISYEIYLSQVEPDEYWTEDPNDYDGRVSAIKNLQKAGVITEYTIEEKYESGIYPVWKAICFVNEELLENHGKKVSETNLIKSNIKILKGETNELSFDFDTGDFILNKTRGNLVLNGQEYNFIKLVLQSPNYQSDYTTLISNIWKNRENTKSSRNDLAQLVKKVKKAFEILPLKSAQNPDIFKNVKGYGYRLMVN